MQHHSGSSMVRHYHAIRLLGTATFFFFFFFFLLRSLAQHTDKFSLVSLRSFTDESSFVHTTRGLIVYSPVVHAGVLQDPRYPVVDVVVH